VLYRRSFTSICINETLTTSILLSASGSLAILDPSSKGNHEIFVHL
jgi:hypothetical protein